jgi:hypothetical protein
LIYSLLHEGDIKFQSADAIWENGVPLKHKIFAWLVVQQRLWMADRRTRHGLQNVTSVCSICLQEEDMTDHLLFQCVHARQVWTKTFLALAILAPASVAMDRFEDWWLASRETYNVQTIGNFDALVLLYSWELWKNRNAAVFDNVSQQRSCDQLVSLVCDNFRLSTWARRGVSGVFHARVGVG